MAFLPLAPVTPPEPRARRYNLLTLANGPIEYVRLPGTLDEFDPGEPLRIAGGLTYQPNGCGVTREYPMVCGPDDESPDLTDKTFDFEVPFTENEPFVVYATLQCGSVGRTAAQMQERTLRKYYDGEPTGVERGLARTMAAAGGPELLSPDPTNIIDVIGTLEQWIYGLQDMDLAGGGTTEGVSYGYQAYIHATPRVAAYASDAHMIIDDRDGRGPFKRTQLGSIWVFGGGYNGAAPGEADPVAGVDHIYVTGQVTVWRDPDVQVPPLRQTFNRGQNQWLGLAERAYVVGFDCHVASTAFDYPGGVSV
jgi:hypothetical protein